MRSKKDDPLTECDNPRPNPEDEFRPFCQQFPSKRVTVNASCDDCERKGIGIRKKVKATNPPVTIYPEYIRSSEDQEQYDQELLEGHDRPLDETKQPDVRLAGESEYPPGLFGENPPDLADPYDQPTHHGAPRRNRHGRRVPRSTRKKTRDSKEKSRCIIL